ncbi:hypothetical protein SapgrDRAFT_0249 [Saprospira grandis DSM 2844]|uniref:Uncharacterized protein n=1 Tax=Saprospira grandis DSM 2844 TaxID=694433 RepID=J0P3K6_9BACT|nr:hypothetical protein [Saprospira grandis]EJF52002.1 hypothetical protein SapgrDRAFT_0249 [Saprospira grandis DSM 2844]
MQNIKLALLAVNLLGMIIAIYNLFQLIAVKQFIMSGGYEVVVTKEQFESDVSSLISIVFAFTFVFFINIIIFLVLVMRKIDVQIEDEVLDRKSSLK